MKTAISLPDDLFRAAEATAKRMGVTRSELFRTALVTFLKEHDRQLITDKLNEIFATESSELDPVLRELQARSLRRLARDDW
jgi:metal-responsive CopG/Arc/MetJ family transcriptional regulator